jgi:uncharacterized metal-binding protein YceD (DUF177 family)
VTAAAPEFSRRVPLALIGREPFRQDIEAGPEERAALARRFGLVALDRLWAAVTVQRQEGAAIRLQARFEAEFVQECVVTLEPVGGSLAEEFALRYGPPEADRHALDLASEEDAFEPLLGEAIDIGEAVAQELSLALPPLPRLPEAALDAAATAQPEEEGPFAALGRLAKP